MLRSSTAKNKNSNRSNLNIFIKYINQQQKPIPSAVILNDGGKIKYLPPISKEWKNSVYYYNSNNSINYPVYDLNINHLIKSYFNLYFKPDFIKHKYIPKKKKLNIIKKYL